MTTKFTWEPSTGGSLLLRVTKGSKTTTWTIKKTTKPRELVRLFGEIREELEDTVPSARMFADEDWTAVPMRETVRTVDQEEMDQITEEMSRQEQARVVERLNASGGQWWDEDLEGLELRTLGKGDPE